VRGKHDNEMERIRKWLHHRAGRTKEESKAMMVKVDINQVSRKLMKSEISA